VAAVAAFDRYLGGRRRIVVAGLLVALLSWRLAFGVPTTGLDSSWMGGLYMAIHDGKDFGNEIVFTYGPLGFLAWPSLWFSWLAVVAYLYSAAIYVAFAVTLTWALKRSLGLLGAALVAFLFFATSLDFEQLPLLLAVGWCYAALREDRPGLALPILVYGGGALSASQCLVKLSMGPPILVICLLGLTGARADRKQWTLFGAVFVGGLLVLWLAAGQSLGSLWDYAVNGFQVASGYNEAMAVDVAPAWNAATLVVIALALVAASTRADFRDRRARRLGIALTVVAAFVTFKYGIVRFEPGHVALALSAMLGIWLLMSWTRQRAAVSLVATAAIAAVFFHAYPNPAKLDVIGNLKAFKETTELLIRPGKRQQVVDQSRASLQEAFKLEPRMLAQLRDKRVAIDPWEIGVAWAYELDWSPLPVFQNYTAYTPKLDRLNAAAVEDPDGPQVILRENPAGLDPSLGGRGFEERLPAWDPPEQNLAIVCNFAPVEASEAWQLLTRTADRCGPPEPISSRDGEPGETIPVPQAGPGELVVLRLKGAGVEGIERLGSLLWRPSPRYAVLNDGEVRYRLVPGTTGDGLIVSRDPKLDSADAFAQLPPVNNIAIEGADGPLSFNFYRVKVQPPPAAPCASRGRRASSARGPSRRRHAGADARAPAPAAKAGPRACRARSSASAPVAMPGRVHQPRPRRSAAGRGPA
jgi:hypothetical protein